MPIPFSCPYCGKQTYVEDQYAGSSGPCAACGKTITVPGKPPLAPPVAYTGRPGASSAAPAVAAGLSVWVILLIVGAAMALAMGILAAVLLPAIHAAREAATIAACKNNLRQITLAFQNYQDQNGELPPRYIPDENGRPMHSWRVLILPYMFDSEAQDIYDEYDFSEPWDGPNNRRLHDRIPRVFRCPSGPIESGGLTSYVVIAGENAPLQPAVPRVQRAFGLVPEPPMDRWQSATSYASLVDGASNTAAVVEVVGLHVNWLEPVDLEFDDALATINHSQDRPCIASRHPTGVNVSFFDGRVQLLRNDTSIELLRRILDPRDGERVDLSNTP